LDPDLNCVGHLKSEELGGEVLTIKTSVRYLGCILDGSMGGVSMANKVLGKVNARTKSLARKSKLLDKDSMKVLATALIQCHFDYAGTFWFGGLSKHEGEAPDTLISLF
jgi:hypothetical protein